MPARFDVFLSHATADKPLVEFLANRLKGQGIEPWLDLWHLVPGEPWQPGLARGLAASAACAAFVGPGGFGSWQEEELHAAINRRVADRSGAFRVIPVLLPGVEKPERAKLPEFLTATMWVEFRGSIDEKEPLRRLVCGIRGLEPDHDPTAAPFVGECPYRGLEFFDFNERDPRFFCGREAQVDDLLQMLRGTLPTDPSGGALRFLAILGPSGSGKSSLARAGLLPALRAGKLQGSERWPVAITRPGREPLTGLATAINGLEGAAALRSYDRVANQADGERSLHVAARLILGEPARAGHLVVLVDQFEEVFTLCDDDAQRRTFIANLLHAARAPDDPTVVVLTMRADFLPRCAPYPALARAVSGRQYLVEPMTRTELRRAIERPARLAGLEPEPGLADLLLDDAEKNPGSLPLFQFVLKELWSRRRGPKLSIEAYRDLGGMGKAVANRADAVLAALEKHGRGEITKRIFLSLVRLGDGTEDTRRRARIAELVPAGGDEAAVHEVLRALTDRDARLVTTSRDGTVEVAHEALIRSWPTLRGWVETDREGERIKQRLDESAAEWAEHDRDPGYLDHGPRLALARKWGDDHPGALSALAVDFLAASVARERAEEEAREADARRRRRMWVAAILSVLATLTLGVAMSVIFALGQRRERLVAEESISYLERFLGEADPDVEPDRAITLREALDRSTERLDKDGLLTTPEVKARLRIALGKIYFNLGEFERSRTLFDEAARIGRQDLGRSHPTAMTALDQLGQACMQLQDFPTAERVLLEAYDLQRKPMALGPNHEDTIQTYAKLGDLYEEMGRYDQAAEITRTVLDQRRRLFGEKYEFTLVSMNGLGLAYRGLGRSAEALPLFDRAEQVSREIHLEDHPATLVYIRNRALACADLGGWPEALKRLSDCLPRQQKVQGDRHLATLRTERGLAVVMLRLGDLDGARSRLESILKRLDPNTYRNHSFRGFVLVNLGECFIEMEKYPEADRVLQEARVLLLKKVGPEHRYSRAAEKALEALRVRRQRGGSDGGQSRRAAEPANRLGTP